MWLQLKVPGNVATTGSPCFPEKLGRFQKDVHQTSNVGERSANDGFNRPNILYPKGHQNPLFLLDRLARTLFGQKLRPGLADEKAFRLGREVGFNPCIAQNQK